MKLPCSALHYIKLCTELYPQNPKAIGAMAVILSHMEDNKNAKLAYKKSIELKPIPSVVGKLFISITPMFSFRY